MRFDVAVNMLVMQAVTRGEVTVFGGDQIRPNIHIDDICDLYLYMLHNPHLVGVFNAGFENISILEIAEMVRAHIDCKIKILDSVDPRTYRLDSSKLIETGFAPRKSVADAIQETINALDSGVLRDQDCFHNLSWMKQKSACWEAGSMNELRGITPASTLNEKRLTVYCEEHSFFTAYAESLQEVLAAADWTNVLELGNVLFLWRGKTGRKFSFVATVVALQMRIT